MFAVSFKGLGGSRASKRPTDKHSIRACDSEGITMNPMQKLKFVQVYKINNYCQITVVWGLPFASQILTCLSFADLTKNMTSK